MGSSTSKAAKSAAGTAARKYPTRVPAPPPHQHQQTPCSARSGPTVHPEPYASSSRDETINLDARDPQYASQLRSLGPVKPDPFLSHSSTFNQSQHHLTPSSQPDPYQSPLGPSSSNPSYPNPSSNPALQILQARSELAERAEEEFAATGRKGFAGREFLDVVMIRQVLMLRDERGMGEEEIERRLGLKLGVVQKLGRKGVVGDVGGGAGAGGTGGGLG
ncbi:MAG: hypothetical protein MMC33_001511 [Icmadophila ericetorum]|nr:hypothetical protein [Icmadophila ericetorum]